MQLHIARTEKICYNSRVIVGEAGVTPARARRREVYFSLSLLPDAANRGQAIGIFIPEKAERRIPQSKYPDDNCLRTMVTSADRSGTKQK